MGCVQAVSGTELAFRVSSSSLTLRQRPFCFQQPLSPDVGARFIEAGECRVWVLAALQIDPTSKPGVHSKDAFETEERRNGGNGETIARFFSSVILSVVRFRRQSPSPTRRNPWEGWIHSLDLYRLFSP